MLELREFDDMVDDTLQRIVDDDVGITNTSIGSVVRSVVEAIMSEVDIAQFTVYQAYLSKTIDDAEGDDLDDVVSILSVVRKQATYCTGEVTFSVTEISDVDIDIPDGSIVSTPQTMSGKLYEFQVVGDCILEAGEESVTVPVICTEPGYVYIVANNVTIINDSIIGIAGVTNENAINGGSDAETDDELRDRAKDALLKFGKGTCDAIRSAVMDVDGVVDVSVYDMKSGVGTVDILVVFRQMPPSSKKIKEVEDVIDQSKAAGIVTNLLLPTIKYIDVDLIIDSPVEYDKTKIYDVVYEYVDTLGIGDTFMQLQCAKRILDMFDNDDVDITFNTPTSNITIDLDEIIKPNNIKIDGVTFLEGSIELPVTTNNILTVPKGSAVYYCNSSNIKYISSVFNDYDISNYKQCIIKGTATYNDTAINDTGQALFKLLYGDDWEDNTIATFMNLVGVSLSEAKESWCNSIVSGLTVDINDKFIEAVNNGNLSIVFQNCIETKLGIMKVVITSITLVK